MQSTPLLTQVIENLHELKAANVNPINVSHLTSIADYMVVATGNSSRHVKSIADHLARQAKDRMAPALSVETDPDGEWVLVDFGDIIVHIMQPRVRDFYNLEKLWTEPSSDESFEPIALSA